MEEFFKKLIGFFDKYNIPYMLSGGVAMGAYTLPRFTRDIDFVVLLRFQDVPSLLENFKDGYYCDEDAVKEAIRQRSMFNIIDRDSNYKADFIILKDDAFQRNEFTRRRLDELMGLKIWIVSPEDLLLSKLIWIQSLQSAYQAEDIKQLSRISGLDWKYINSWVDELKLNTFDLLKK
jgi:hypothetical protein